MGKIQSILIKLFSEIVDRNFNFDQLDDRIIMQKIVFFLSELGITINEYRFTLETYGPFSQSLSNDVHEICASTEIYSDCFPDFISSAITFLKQNIFAEYNNKCKYTMREWLEAISTLVYVKRYMRPTDSLSELASNLSIIKTNMVHVDENEKVIPYCEAILSYNTSK